MHDFILDPAKGWRLCDAYDMSPVAIADGLKLNITEADNALDMELAREMAAYFRVKPTDAEGVIEAFKAVVRQWQVLTSSLQLSHYEQERMAPAFRLAEA